MSAHPRPTRTLRGLLVFGGVSALLVSAASWAWWSHATAADPVTLAEWQPIPPSEIDSAATLADGRRPAPGDPVARARMLQAEVERLEAAVQERQDELEAVLTAAHAEVDQQSEAATRARRRAATLEAEVEALSDALAAAVQQRDTGRDALQAALVELEVERVRAGTARVAASRFRRANIDNLWSAFVNNAAVQVCDRGTPKAHERCRAELAESLDRSAYQRFARCVALGNAVPTLDQYDARDPLPATTEVIATDGWLSRQHHAVNWCDPGLSDGAVATDLLAQPAPRFAALSSGLPR